MCKNKYDHIHHPFTNISPPFPNVKTSSRSRRHHHEVDLGPHQALLGLEAPGHQNAVPRRTEGN